MATAQQGDEDRTRAAAADFLQSCMFFADDDGGEDTPEDEIALYFHPAAVPLRRRLMLLGACAGIAHFVENFASASAPVRVLQLERHTLAFARLAGGLTVALSGPCEEPVASLQRRLSRVVAWFRFLHGSFARVKAACAGRKELCRAMAAIGDALVESFVRPGGAAVAAGLAPVFLPLPVADLPGALARHFVAASQLLADVRADAANLAGCVLCGPSAVLCTQLGAALTDAVLMLADALCGGCAAAAEASDASAGGGSGGGGSERRASLDAGPRTFFHTVFLTRAEAEALRSPPTLPASFASSASSASGSTGHGACTLSSLSSSPGTVAGAAVGVSPDSAGVAAAEGEVGGEFGTAAGDGEEGEEDEDEEENVVQLGLFLLSLQSVTLAVVMTAEALADPRHTKRLHKLAHSELLSIDNGLAPFFLHQLKHDGCAGDGAASGSPVGSQGQIASAAAAAGAAAAGSGDGQWALFDSLTGTLKVSPGANALPTADTFQSLAGVAHDTLAMPGVSQVYLRRRTGCVLSHKLFAKELHWFTPLQAATSHERFTEFVERSKNASNTGSLFL